METQETKSNSMINKQPKPLEIAIFSFSCEVAKLKKNTTTGKYSDEFTFTKKPDGSTEYACKHCPSVFRSNNSYVQHYRQVHLKERPKLRACHLCDVKVPEAGRKHGVRVQALPERVPKQQQLRATLPPGAPEGAAQAACMPPVRRQSARYIKFTFTKKPDGSTEYACKHCPSVFRSNNSYVQHYRQVHLKERPKLRACHLCDVKKPDGSTEYACKHCPSVFRSNNSYVQHYRQVHLKERPKLRACHLCDVKVPGAPEGAAQAACMPPVRRQSARYIKFTFTKKPDGSTEYACKYCQSVFRSNNSYVQHYRQVHLKERPKLRACHLCDVKVPGAPEGAAQAACMPPVRRQSARYIKFTFTKKPDGSTEYACKYCQSVFRSNNSYVQHYRQVHLKERPKLRACHLCDVKVPGAPEGAAQAACMPPVRRQSARYIKFTFTKKPDGSTEYACKYCQSVFRSNNSYVQHYRQVHLKERPKLRACHLCDVKVPGFLKFTLMKKPDGSTQYACKHCPSVFRSNNSYVQHYRQVHLKERPKLRACHLCDVKVPGYMRAFHMEQHGLPAPSCGSCGKKFAYPHQVLRHQKTFHMGEKNFVCTTCNFRFSTNYDLKNHEKTHSSHKPFSCEYCSKTFRWKKSLKTHVMIHLGVKNHACAICKAAFVQQSSLKYHMAKKHPENPNLY
ncbi:zinc finger protein 16-like [Maniola jurtina]|uniref:zinc finger protein 16-like n=1 Tax=Maniola jurtina TaxID=191418 RepID=UPI001E68F047|nr:zinc finger protein 16-like [Maniola jurtina]